MKKNNLYTTFMCGALVSGGVVFSDAAYGQMVDMMSHLAIQGQMNAQSAGQIGQALNMMKQNDIIQQMNMMILDIQMRPKSSYKDLNRNQMPYQLSPLDWHIGPHQEKQFFIELRGVDSASCQRFVYAFPTAKTVLVNNIVNGSCETRNNIKFVFE